MRSASNRLHAHARFPGVAVAKIDEGHHAPALGLKFDDLDGAAAGGDRAGPLDMPDARLAVCFGRAGADEGSTSKLLARVRVNDPHVARGPGVHASDLAGNVGGGAGPVDLR